MASRYFRLYPPNSRLLFDGGKNSKFERALIEDNESPDCANVIFDNNAVETRQGFQKLNTTSVGSFVNDGLYTRRSNTNTETMCAWFNGSMYTLATTTFVTVPSAQSVYTAGVNVQSEMSENYIFFGNGTQPYKYNGAEFTRQGVTPATQTAAAASGSAGPLTGDYRYVYTTVNSNLVESDISPAMATFTAAAASITVSNIQTFAASFGINARKLYRTAAGGTTYKLVTTISNNTATTYSDGLVDASLGATAPTDQGLPPQWNVIKFHQGRLFVNDPSNRNFLWYSELNNPYVFKTTNFIRIGDNTSDLIQAIEVYNNSLAVICESSVYLIYMPSSDATTWQPIKTKSPYGSKSYRAVFNYNDKLFFPAVDTKKFVGFASLQGINVTTSATFLTQQAIGSDRISDRIEPDMFNVQESFLSNISAFVFKNKAWISLAYGSSQTTNNRIYQMDFTKENLAKNQEVTFVPFTGIQASQFCVYGGSLYFGSANAVGFVYKAESGQYNDDGAAIDSYFWTKEFSGFKGDEPYSKDFRICSILVEKSGNWNMNLRYRSDSDRGSGDLIQINLNPGGSLWGTMIWGTDLWGGGMDQEEIKNFLAGKRGQRIQFRFDNDNTIGSKFKVLGMKFQYNKKGFR